MTGSAVVGMRRSAVNVEVVGLHVDAAVSGVVSGNEFDLRELLRNGASDADIEACIEAAVGTKWAGHQINQVNFVRPARTMSQIGG